MWRSIGAVIIGLFVGGLVIGLVESTGHNIYPSGLTLESSYEEKEQYVNAAPIMALMFLPLAYLVGTFVGGFVTGKIASQGQSKLVYTTCAILFTFGIINMFQNPHPLWLNVVAIVAFVLATFLAIKLSGKRS